ncbi:MAG: hypothetical protein WEE64_16355 [Dehalococcoidia bacterium]
MTSVHPVRPTDLVALVAFDGRVYPNEAMTRDRLGSEASSHPLETALDQWLSFATGRHTWISVKGATLRGLVSARRRGSKAAWEIDCLIDAAEDDEGVLLSLLDRLAADAGRAGAEKVFLRMPAGSGTMATVARTGFVAWQGERLMVREGKVEPHALSAPERATLRRWGRADAYATFRLYNRSVPESVRRVEAATFREWNAARERVSPPRQTRQWVVECGGQMAGWLRTGVDGELGRFDLMADASAPELQDFLIDVACARLARQERLLTLVPEAAVGLRERLEQRGFQERESFVVLARRVARPVRMPQLATAQAQTMLA